MSWFDVYLLIGLLFALTFIVTDWYEGQDLKIKDVLAASMLIPGWLIFIPLVFGVEIIRWIKAKLGWKIGFNTIILRGRR